MDENDSPPTMNAAAAPNYFTVDEVQLRLDRLTAVECWKLLEVARIYSDGTSWLPEDLLQEAFEAASARRAWRVDLTVDVFMTGIMRSLAFAQRKAERVNALDAGVAGAEEDRQQVLHALPDESANDPQRALADEQDYRDLVMRLSALFSHDPEVVRVIQGRAQGESAAETRAALGVDATHYETICRRLSRGYRQSIKRQAT